jgi:hypothetical protein
VDDDLLPDPAPLAILEIVDLVEHDHPDILEVRAIGIHHVAQHLGGHHHDRGGAVDRVVTGQQAHGVVAMSPAEVAELLVGQRLERSGVDGAPAHGPGPGDGGLGDHRLARPGGCRHDDGSPAIDGVGRFDLESIRGEGKAREIRAGGHRRTVKRTIQIVAS